MAPLLPILFGEAAAAATATTAATAATTGLIGTGGAFALAPTLTTVGVLGTGMSALSQLGAGKTAQAVGDYNAQLMKNQAVAQSEATKQETYKLSRKANQVAGQQAAAYAGAGLSLEGTPLEVMADTAREYEKDILLKGYSGDVGVAQDINQASLSEWEGAQRRKASYWQAGSTLLTGVGKISMAKGWFS